MSKRTVYRVVTTCTLLLSLGLPLAARAQHPEGGLVLRLRHSCGFCIPSANYVIELYADGFVNYECTSRNKPSGHKYYVPKQEIDSLVNAFLAKGVFAWMDSYAPRLDSGNLVVEMVSESSLTELSFWHDSRSKHIRYDRWPPPALPELLAALLRVADTRQWWPHPSEGVRIINTPADTTKH
jgi:hypothetical protein